MLAYNDNTMSLSHATTACHEQSNFPPCFRPGEAACEEIRYDDEIMRFFDIITKPRARAWGVEGENGDVIWYMTASRHILWRWLRAIPPLLPLAIPVNFHDRRSLQMIFAIYSWLTGSALIYILYRILYSHYTLFHIYGPVLKFYKLTVMVSLIFDISRVYFPEIYCWV